MGRVMPCRGLAAEDIWLSDITVEGMRLGERLDVLVTRRRELCRAEPPELVGVDAAGLPLALLSGGELAEASAGVLLCRGDAPCDEPPAALPVEREQSVWGES